MRIASILKDACDSPLEKHAAKELYIVNITKNTGRDDPGVFYVICLENESINMLDEFCDFWFAYLGISPYFVSFVAQVFSN